MRATSWERGLGMLLVSILAVPVLGAAEPVATWPQWRGPGGQGVSLETGLPLEWSATQNVRWKTPIPGRGHSSPIVWGERIFLTTAVEGDVVAGAKAVSHLIEGKEFVHPDGVGADRRQTLKVLAVDRENGRILWERTAWEGTPYDTRHKRGSFASPTPVTDGRLVYAYFGSEGVYAYDFDGRLAWKSSLGGIATLGVGVGTSPVLHHDLLILQCDEDNGDKSFIVALDKETGKEAWRAARKVHVSWATPIVVTAGGRDELITSGAEAVIAYDPATGKELWRSKGLESNAVPSPVAAGDLVHGLAGGVRGAHPPLQRRRGHVRAQGGTDARGAPDEPAGRADPRHPGRGRRGDLHTGGQPPLCHRQTAGSGVESQQSTVDSQP